MPRPLSIFESNKVVAENLISDKSPPSDEVLSISYKLISAWASVEKRQLDFIIQMLDGSSSVAASAFLTLNGAGPKMAFLRGAAKKALNDTEIEYLECILSATKPIMKFRNKLAHWSIIQVEGLEDYLILQNPIQNVKEGLTHDRGIFVFDKAEINLHIKKMHCLWQCYHYMIDAYKFNRNEITKRTYDRTYGALRETLLTVDKELHLPQRPEAPSVKP